MKKTCIILTILLAVLLLVACGAEDKKQTPTAPDKPESTVDESTDPLSRIVIVMQDSRFTPKSKEELASALAEMASLGADGECNVLLQVYGAGNVDPDLKIYIQKQNLNYQSSMDYNAVRGFGLATIPHAVFTTMNPTFFYDVAAFAKVVCVEIVLGSATVMEEFPFEVGYYSGDRLIPIYNESEMEQYLAMCELFCGEGKTYNGIGVHLYGYEVQKSDIDGIPYCHLSYGTKDNLMTVMGFGHDVLGELDAHLVVELLRICPYFTKVEFFFVKDPTAPVR